MKLFLAANIFATLSVLAAPALEERQAECPAPAVLQNGECVCTNPAFYWDAAANKCAPYLVGGGYPQCILVGGVVQCPIICSPAGYRINQAEDVTKCRCMDGYRPLFYPPLSEDPRNTYCIRPCNTAGHFVPDQINGGCTCDTGYILSGGVCVSNNGETTSVATATTSAVVTTTIVPVTTSKAMTTATTTATPTPTSATCDTANGFILSGGVCVCPPGTTQKTVNSIKRCKSVCWSDELWDVALNKCIPNCSLYDEEYVPVFDDCRTPCVKPKVRNPTTGRCVVP